MLVQIRTRWLVELRVNCSRSTAFARARRQSNDQSRSPRWHRGEEELIWIGMISLALAVMTMCVGFFWWGFREGVKEAEDRWSDIVEKADWHRRHGA